VWPNSCVLAILFTLKKVKLSSNKSLKEAHRNVLEEKISKDPFELGFDKEPAT